MKTKILSISALMLACTAVSAQDSLFNSAAQALQTGQSAEQAVKNTPASTEALAKQAAAKKLKQATPAELQQGIDASKKIKAQVNAAPKTSGDALNAAESSEKQKAAAKALDLLQ